MPKPLKDKQILPNRSMKEWSSLGIKRYVLLMIEFLRISPSYALAHHVRTHKLTTNQKNQMVLKLFVDKKGDVSINDLLIDFDKVLSTYDIYGDIYKVSFEEWWISKGIYIYGVEHEKPRVRQIARVEKEEKIELNFHRALEHYFKKLRVNEGEPSALILSIPLGMPKKSLLQQVSKLIDLSKVDLPIKSQRAKKPLAAKRLRSEPLFKMIELLWSKSMNPTMEQWRLGIKAEVSPSLNKRLDVNMKANSNNVEERYMLNVVTSRMLTKAKLVAENAARDVFPSHKPRALPNFDYDEIYKRIKLSKPKLKPQVK